MAEENTSVGNKTVILAGGGKGILRQKKSKLDE